MSEDRSDQKICSDLETFVDNSSSVSQDRQPKASRTIMQIRIQGVNVFLVLQEISQGFPIPYLERSLNPSSTRKLEVKDE